MGTSRRRPRWTGGFLSGGVAGFLGLALWVAGVFVRPEGWAFDTLARWARAGTRLPESVAVVLVDEASLEFMETRVGRWPWPRRVWAEVTEFLFLGGARSVVWDILFTEPQGPPDNPDDSALASATASGPVVHAAQFVAEVPDEAGSALPKAVPEAVRARFAWGRVSDAVESGDRAYLPIEPVLHAAWAIGAVDLTPDPDGVYRRVPLWRGWGGWAFPSLGPAALGPSAISPERPVFRERGVPVDGRGRVLLNPYGDIPAYSVSGILASLEAFREGRPLLVDPSEFAGRIVLIGASAAGLEDLKPAPLSPLTPGVFLHATLLGNLLNHDLLHPLPGWMAPAALGVGALLVAAWAQAARGPVAAGLGASAVGLGWVGLAVAVFRGGVVLPVAGPVGGVLLGLIAGLGHRAATEDRQRRRLRRMFAQYVSPAVLEEVVERFAEEAAPGTGQKEELTILFSDIRGFTTLAERLDPQDVVTVLNVYLGAMAEVIFEHGGTIDKFIGDAIMCFWGAPLRCDDHAERGVRCALGMLDRLEGVNRELEGRGLPAVRIGIGLHTGTAVLGNIGSARRLDYTAIGDAVNLASRLEGLTKTYGCPVLLTESTFARLGGSPVCAVVDRVRVKGKNRPILLYRPVGWGEDAGVAARRFEEAFRAYSRREWEQALRAYEALGTDPVARLFVERCRVYRAVPPGQDWDGVWTMTHK